MRGGPGARDTFVPSGMSESPLGHVLHIQAISTRGKGPKPSGSNGIEIRPKRRTSASVQPVMAESVRRCTDFCAGPRTDSNSDLAIDLAVRCAIDQGEYKGKGQ